MGDRLEDAALTLEHTGGYLSELADLAGGRAGKDVGDHRVLPVVPRAHVAVGERIYFPERANVLDHTVREQAMPDLGSLILDNRRWSRGLRARKDRQIVERISGDHHQAGGAERDGRLERRVETDAAVYVPVAIIVIAKKHWREHRWDRGRRPDNIGGNNSLVVVDRAAIVASGQAWSRLGLLDKYGGPAR